MLDAAVAAADVHGEEVFKPGDLRVGVPAGGAQHGGRARPLHHFQLGAHVDGGEPVRNLVLCNKGGGYRVKMVGWRDRRRAQ